MLFNHSTSPDPYAGSQGNGSSSCLVCHPINGRLQKQVLPIMGSPRYFVLHSSLNKLTVNTRAAQLSLQAPASQIKLPVVMTHPCVEDGSWLPVKPANTRWNSSTTAIDRVFASLNPGVRRVLTLPDTMGIKGLTKLLADNAPGSMKEETFESYFGRKIAIDASMSIYQFLIVVGRVGADTLTNEAGEVTSHLQGMFNRTIRLLEAGIKPVYVFDGKPPDLKRQELNKRFARREDASENLAELKETGEKADIEKYSKRTVKVTKQHNEDCRRLLRLMGVPVIEAPSEAEAECAALCKAHKVHAVASEDMDSLTFGSPRFLRHLMEPASRKIPVMEYEISKILAELNLTMDQFIDMCILCGCDYCDTIRGIGAQTALKLIRQHGSLEAILENLNKDRYQITDPWPFEEARRLFKEPSVTAVEEQPELKWLPPDVEGLKKFLVDENGFNHDRVVKAIEKIKAAKNKASQGRLESFFKPSTIVSSKTKRNPDLQQSRTAAVHKRAKGAGRGSGKK